MTASGHSGLPRGRGGARNVLAVKKCAWGSGRSRLALKAHASESDVDSKRPCFFVSTWNKTKTKMTWSPRVRLCFPLDMMETVDLRQIACEHLNQAKKLLITPGLASARYSCLELRMAIEALTYSSLQNYLAEVPNTVMRKWPPKQVLDELLAVDPMADQSRTLAIGRQQEEGILAREMHTLGEDRRFSVKWANRAHNALSSFLHSPTLAQRQRGIGDMDAAARTKAAEVAEELDAVLASRIWNVNFSQSCTFECSCGFTVKRRKEIIEAGEPIVCAACGLHYRSEPTEGGANFWPLEGTYTCSGCGSDQAINERDLLRLPIVSCSACGFRSQVIQEYRLLSLEESIRENGSNESIPTRTGGV